MRIAIVNDMRMAVEALRRVVTSVPDYEVAWIAADGEEAVRECAADVPDVILMDLIMPRMDGVEAIAAHHGGVAVRDSGRGPRRSNGNSVEGLRAAIGWGALDAVNTPVLGMSGEPAGAAALLGKKLSMLGKLLGEVAHLDAAAAIRDDRHRLRGSDFPLIAIGASTGGDRRRWPWRCSPRLPPALKAAITIVQHVDEQFAPGLASWLSGQSSREVRIIRPGDPISSATERANRVHQRSSRARRRPHLRLHQAIRWTFRIGPSVDVFFRSVASTTGAAPAVGVLLTGMGADGAQEGC